MRQDIERIVQNTFELKPDEGENKGLPLPEAVERNIKPGMNMHVSPSANALLCQIIRRFNGTKPQFTLTVNAVGGYIINLVNEGQVKKLITRNCSFYYPTPGPVPLVQQAYRRHEIEIENWSTYTLLQRLMASALGLEFMPTKSMLGTTTAAENCNDLKEIKNPFDESQKLGIVKALSPDIALIHGCVADQYGNTVLAPPLIEGIWGPAASRK